MGEVSITQMLRIFTDFFIKFICGYLFNLCYPCAKKNQSSDKTNKYLIFLNLYNMLVVRLNLRRVAAIAACLAGSATIYAQEIGVVINGVTWATRNVDSFGTFAPTPESSGMFYQWNRPTAWAATGSVTGWDNSTPTGTMWETANDPSPAGWSVPTKAELESLLNTTYVTQVWTTQNGTNGLLFTDNATGNSIFLPAAGYRNFDVGTLSNVNMGGYYWSSTEQSDNGAYYLVLYNGNVASLDSNNKTFGFSIRPVKDPSVTTYNIMATAETGGTISPNGTITVNYADSQTFTFSANSGYEISQVLIDNLNNFPAVAAGTYTFTNVAANHTIEVYFSPITGISEVTAEKMTIYPNPTNGQLRVSGDILDGKDREIIIYNVVSQVVFTYQLSKLSHETTIDISHLANGLYFLKVGGKVVKIVKE